MKNKLYFFWRDKESMIITGLLPKVGIEYICMPGASAYKGMVGLGNGDHVSVYITKTAHDESIESGKKFLDEAYSKKYFKESGKLRREYDRFIRNMRKLDVKGLDNRDIIRLLERLWWIEIKGIAFFSGSQAEPLVAAEKRLRQILSSLYPAERINEMMEILLVSKRFDKAQQQEMDWARLVRSRKKLTKKDFCAHGIKYPFLFRNSYDMKKSFECLAERFDEDKKNLKMLNKNLTEMKLKKAMIIKKQQKIIRELKNKEVKHILWIFQKLAIERMDMKYTWAGVEDFLFYDLFVEAAKRIGEDYSRMVSYYTPDEIIKALNGGGKLNEREIENRNKAFLLGIKDNKAFLYSGQDAIDMAKKEYPELLEIRHEDMLKGTPASPGKMRGEVMVIFSEGLEDIAKFSSSLKQGQIIVTPMTQPNMMPLVMKAGAIVTDEGGLTSHAAVVSREFGKPCIVGTHRATQVFKTGDYVEVDATNGVVRRIKMDKDESN